MKNIALKLCLIFAFACACSKEIQLPDAPSIEILGMEDGKASELMSIRYAIASIYASGGIQLLTIDISSPTLSPGMLEGIGLSEHFDLVSPGECAEALSLYGLACGPSVKGAVKLDLDLTFLIDLLQEKLGIAAEHSISISLDDSFNQVATARLLIHQDPLGDIRISEVDLWAGTASVTLDSSMPKGSSLKYRLSGTAQWNDMAEAEGAPGTYRIEPVWEKADTEPVTYHIVEGTGIKAESSYEIALMDKSGQSISTLEYTSAAGDVLPNNNFTNWYTKDGRSNGLAYPNAAPTTAPYGFWDSGNNTFSPNLCTAIDGEGARLKSGSVKLFGVLTPGNISIGDFELSGMEGVVRFGKHFDWTARPTALQIRYTIRLGKIDCEKHTSGHKGEQDMASIIFAIVDWSSQHPVVSGPNRAPSGSVNPSARSYEDEGPVIGYCMGYISESSDSEVTLTLPFHWYDITANPSSARYNVYGTFSNSRYGEFLTGCSSNEWCISYIGFVY